MKRKFMPAVRIAAAWVLGMAAMFLVFCEPADYSPHWIRDLLLTKAFGAISAYAAFSLSGIGDNNKYDTENED